MPRDRDDGSKKRQKVITIDDTDGNDIIHAKDKTFNNKHSLLESKKMKKKLWRKAKRKMKKYERVMERQMKEKMEIQLECHRKELNKKVKVALKMKEKYSLHMEMNMEALKKKEGVSVSIQCSPIPVPVPTHPCLASPIESVDVRIEQENVSLQKHFSCN